MTSMTRKTALAATALAALAPALLCAPTALADGMGSDGVGPGGHVGLGATLNPVPLSRVTGSGTARVSLEGNQATVTLKTQGLLAGAPHAQHFHIGAKGECPDADAARMHNGHLSINVSDAASYYGMIGASLTTSGDTSAKSGLAVDRFPTDGSYTYRRTFTVDDATAKSLRAGTGVVVVHGVDYNGNGKYDNVLGPSDLDPKLPSEATNPALCGPLRATASGPVAAGEGGTQAGDNTTTALAAGGALLLAAGGSLFLRRRSGRSAN